jgi:hypothetical protein
MSKTIIIFFFLIFSFNSFSQEKFNLNTNFNWAYAGENIEFTFQKNYRHTSISFGFTYNLNIPYKDNQFHVFKNRYIADDFISRFGTAFSYKLHFIPNNSDILPFVFYNLRYFKSKLYIDGLSPYGMYNNSYIFIKYNNEYTNKLPVLENNIGVGLSCKLYKDIYLSAQAGAGIGFFYIDNDVPFVKTDYWEWSVTTLLSVGLSYSIN